MPVNRKRQSDEMTAFHSVLRRVLQVSKSELNQRLADEKAANAGKPKRGPKPKQQTSSESTE